MTALYALVALLAFAAAVASCSLGAWLLASVVLWALAVRAVAEGEEEGER